MGAHEVWCAGARTSIITDHLGYAFCLYAAAGFLVVAGSADRFHRLLCVRQQTLVCPRCGLVSARLTPPPSDDPAYRSRCYT